MVQRGTRPLYRARRAKDLSAAHRNLFRLPGLAAAVALALAAGGCSLSSHLDTFSANPASLTETTGSIGTAGPTEADLAFARVAAADVLARGGKDASQVWENPTTGARGSVTPLANAYSADGRICRDFLASYVRGAEEAWMQGAACKSAKGAWEIRDMSAWRRS